MVVTVVDRTRSNHQIFTRPAGVLSVQVDREARGKPTFLPIGFIAHDRTASLTFVNNHPSIRLREEKGDLILTEQGFYRGTGAALAKLNRYTDASLQTIGRAFYEDTTLQQALMRLANGLFGVTSEFIATSGIAPDAAMIKFFSASQESRRGFAKRPGGYKCEVTTVATTVTEAVYGWANHITTAGAQLVSCGEHCMALPALEIPGCLAGCASQAFNDIVTRTWEVVDTVSHTVVQHITHCLLTPGNFPSYNGLVAAGGVATIAPAGGKAADADPTLLPFEQLLRCFVGGAWSIGNLGDIGVTIPGVESVPVIISICMSRSCADEVKAQFGTLGFQALATNLPVLIASGAAQAWLAANTTLAPLLTALAASAGITLVEAIAVVLVALLVLAVQALLIAGQIVALEAFGQAVNGICLNYPAFPIALVGIINPVVGLVIAANTPVIVTSRT